jgi:hypothetical protein
LRVQELRERTIHVPLETVAAFQQTRRLTSPYFLLEEKNTKGRILNESSRPVSGTVLLLLGLVRWSFDPFTLLGCALGKEDVCAASVLTSTFCFLEDCLLFSSSSSTALESCWSCPAVMLLAWEAKLGRHGPDDQGACLTYDKVFRMQGQEGSTIWSAGGKHARETGSLRSRSQLERHGHSAVGPYSVDHCINLTIQEPPIYTVKIHASTYYHNIRLNIFRGKWQGLREFSAEPYTVTFTNGCYLTLPVRTQTILLLCHSNLRLLP